MSDLNAFLAEQGGESTEQENMTPPGGETPAGEETPPAEEPNQETGGEETPPPPADEEQPPAGLDKRGEAIWREERNKRKELQAQVDRMNERWIDLVGRMQQQQQQPTQPPQQPPESKPGQETIEVPDFDEDPIGHLRAKNEILERQLTEVNADRQQRQQTTAQMQQFQQLQAGVSQMEAEFAKATPDYHDAVGFMYANVAKMAEAMGYPPQQIQQTISQMAMDISVRALQQGKNPAQAAYEAARGMGYTGAKPPEQPPTGGEQTPRPQAPTSLSSVAGKRSSPGGMPSLDTISKMEPDEFDKFWAELEKTARH